MYLTPFTIVALAASVAGGLSAFVVYHVRIVGRLSRMAYRDPLTNALNRRAGEAVLDRMARQKRAAIVSFDLDHFKMVNDTFGHAAGDEVLKAAVRIAGSLCRKGDEVVRTGGEEFHVVMPDTSLEEAQSMAERFRHALDTEVEFGKLKIKITASFGVAPIDRRDTQTALQKVDEALYAAKRQGRNRVVVAA